MFQLSGKQFIVFYTGVALLFSLLLIAAANRYLSDLLILLIIPILGASQIYPRYVYACCSLFATAFALLTLFVLNHTYYLDTTLFVLSLCSLIVAELVYRQAQARRLALAERDQLIEELQQALAQVKTLKGLLPICASCKKIRDDQGYWNRIEEYLLLHSDAEFTHGICPECMKKVYSEYLQQS